MAGGAFDYAKGGGVKDPNDYTNAYNTQLTPQEERSFREWAGDKVRDLYDYDLRGFWKSGAAFSENGHGADTYKKPNHPTFSVGSKYHGSDGNIGGVWGEDQEGHAFFVPSEHNLKNMPLPELKRYFDKVEPDVLLSIDPTTIEEAPE